MAKAQTKEKPSAGGTYVYDAQLGRVIQVSKDIPKVASKGRKAAGSPSCGRDAGGCCGGGACQS